MRTVLKLFDFRQKVNYRTEILSGLTVAVALVPEAVAFSFLAGLEPLVGLYAAFVVGLVTAILGGRPGMISGATGAVAIVIFALAQSHGVEYVFATVVLAGILQVITGALKLGKLMRLVPLPVVYGFVNGLAIIIFMAQLKVFQDPSGDWLPSGELLPLVGLVLLTMAIIWLFPRITKGFPAALAAILVVFAVVYLSGMETSTVGDMASIKGGFPPFHIPQVPWTFETLQVIWPYAAIMASVGLIESLLTLELIDEITETRGRTNKEAAAQGVANIASGFFSGMGGCAMLGQSMINISNGARARLSGITAAVALLAFVMVGSSWIELLPIAALTGVMIMVAIGTFEWVSVRILNRYPISDVLVMVLVVLITVFMHNLALAVFAGVVVSTLVFAWDNSKRIRARKRIDENGVKYYEIYGPLFFASIKTFKSKFDPLNDPKEIVIDFRESRIADMSAIQAVNNITERYHREGKKVYLTNLSSSSHKLLLKADKVVNVNVLKD